MTQPDRPPTRLPEEENILAVLQDIRDLLIVIYAGAGISYMGDHFNSVLKAFEESSTRVQDRFLERAVRAGSATSGASKDI